MLGLLDHAYILQRDTFMNEPLRYSQTAFLPLAQSRSRAQIRVDLENALVANSIDLRHSRVGKGVYMVDNYVVGDFIVYVACARRGGRMIGFELTS